MRNFAGGEPEADRFILDLHRARAFAALAHVRFGADKSMSKTAGLMLTLATAGAVIIFASPGNAIECDRGTQKVNGQMIYTPYCQDEYLSEVAREYGFKASAARAPQQPQLQERDLPLRLSRHSSSNHLHAGWRAGVPAVTGQSPRSPLQADAV